MSLEEDFTKLVEGHKAEIEAKIKEACAALSEAVKLSNQYGIPFYSRISFLGNTYLPQSFCDKYVGIDTDVVESLTDVYCGEDAEYPGWHHSAVC